MKSCKPKRTYWKYTDLVDDWTITSKYYDTLLGYYTLSNDYSGVVTVPNKDESYIEVYYK